MSTTSTSERAAASSDVRLEWAAGALLAALPPLTNVQRQAFREQFTPIACEGAGRRADPEIVYREVLGLVPAIDQTIGSTPLLVRRYGRARFAWLLECLRDMGEILELRRATPADGVPRVARIRHTAARVHEDLVEALSILAGGDDDERARLIRAAGHVAPRVGDVDSPLAAELSHEALAASLHALGRLADDWLDRDGPTVRALVASVDLTRADVEAAHAAAHAATAAAGDAPPHDAPALTRAVGRVLLELELAKGVFLRAHRLDDRVPLLELGPAALAALAGREEDAAASHAA